MPINLRANEEQWLTSKEAAEKLKVGILQVARLCREKTLVAKKLGRDWFVSPQSVDEYLSALWEGRRGARLMRPTHLRKASK